jgi:hypothetical protein
MLNSGPMARIIALCGAKRSGKDTVADFISGTYGHTKTKFAGKLKTACKQLFDLSEDQVEGDGKDSLDMRYDRTPRQLMQFFGTEMMQFKLQEMLPNTGRLFWTRSLLENHKEGAIVISDMRFVHEAHEVLRHDPRALIIRINRPFNCACDDHCSEKEYLEIPSAIDLVNDGTVEELRDKVRKLLLVKLHGH